MPLPDFRGIENERDIAAAAANFGFPFMLKSRTCVTGVRICFGSTHRHHAMWLLPCLEETFTSGPLENPLCLCASRLAYDGRGNAVVREEAGSAVAVDSLGGYRQGLYAERWAPYIKVETLSVEIAFHLKATRKDMQWLYTERCAPCVEAGEASEAQDHCTV